MTLKKWCLFLGSLHMSYLSVYNHGQACLWFAGLVLMVLSFIVDGLDGYLKLYYILVQSIMILDVVHVLVGLVRAGIVTTAMQISSRLLIVWYILPCQDNFTINHYLMFTAWSFAEMIRYEYYENRNSRLLLFLRYNAFLVLYPVGVLGGEVPLLFRHYRATGNLFDIFALAVYVPGFPFLFFHMLKLRRANMRKKQN